MNADNKANSGAVNSPQQKRDPRLTAYLPLELIAHAKSECKTYDIGTSTMLQYLLRANRRDGTLRKEISYSLKDQLQQLNQKQQESHDKV